MDDFAVERAWIGASRRAALTHEGAEYAASGPRVRGRGWTHAMNDPFHCQAFALAVAGPALLVAHHCPATSGASLSFLDRATGTPIAETHPGTLGTIGHSAYAAAMELAVDGDRAYLRGEESGGRYASIVDLAEHQTLAVAIWR